MKSITKLAAISASPFPVDEPRLDALVAALGEASASCLWPLLSRRNGFFSFKSALQVFGFGEWPFNIASWNSGDGWRKHYGALTDNLLFFAQDVFAGQYAIRDGVICKFDPELGEVSEFAESIEQWCEQILDDYDYESGYTYANDWQVVHGPLAPGERLFPKLAFVLGGDYEVENFWSSTVEKAAPLRGFLAQRLVGTADGTHIRLKLPDDRVIEGVLQR
jgi:hypothetical protein